MPAPPSSSLHGTPRRPSSPIALMLSQGKVEVRSSSRATGRDMVAGKVAHHLADLMMLLGEVEGVVHG